MVGTSYFHVFFKTLFAHNWEFINNFQLQRRVIPVETNSLKIYAIKACFRMYNFMVFFLRLDLNSFSHHRYHLMHKDTKLLLIVIVLLLATAGGETISFLKIVALCELNPYETIILIT